MGTKSEALGWASAQSSKQCHQRDRTASQSQFEKARSTSLKVLGIVGILLGQSALAVSFDCRVLGSRGGSSASDQVMIVLSERAQKAVLMKRDLRKRGQRLEVLASQAKVSELQNPGDPTDDLIEVSGYESQGIDWSDPSHGNRCWAWTNPEVRITLSLSNGKGYFQELPRLERRPGSTRANCPAPRVRIAAPKKMVCQEY